ncbi:MAG TPA: bifunctional diaminohydroxyphosphoribosylaminopyrimidine deaminase/5-amino-6-(5-phosphoribosylamino)uracil reductase RibD [Verrucomicrobiae bacterium]
MNKTPDFMRLALALARHGYGVTSPNPMVGAVLVNKGEIIGRGWHRRAGMPHAEIEALRAAQQRKKNPRGATLYVTLEPCSTHGRTPPCTDAIIASGIRKVITGATDPNPKHAGNAFKILRRAGIEVIHGTFAQECERLNEAFNHWIVHGTPFVTVKAAMTLDGKIAAASGESKWITGEKARGAGMQMRQGADAVLVGVNTILADNPSLTFRPKHDGNARTQPKPLRRIILDSMARTPLEAKVVCDKFAALTTIVVSRAAPKKRISALGKRANILAAPLCEPLSSDNRSLLDLRWLMKRLGSENVTSILVEGGGETNASFLFNGLAQRVAFFYAPRLLGGSRSLKAVAGEGVKDVADAIRLEDVEWKKVGEDLMMTARVGLGRD